MCKILIAEDEVWISALIRSIVKKGCPDAEVVGEAANGRVALEMIGALRPDIVLADINMPVINGLQVIEEAKKAGFLGKFIIISGYKDFSYVQQALRIGVEDYLLKPIDDEKLCAVIRRVKQKQDGEISDTRQSTQSDALLKAQFFNKLLVSGYPTMAACNSAFGLRFASGVFRCAVVKFTHGSLDHSYLIVDRLTGIWESIRRCVKEQYLPLSHEAFFLQQGSYVILFLNYAPDAGRELSHRLERLFLALLSESAAQSLQVTMGLSEECSEFTRLSDAYRQAHYAVAAHLPAGKGRIFSYSDIRGNRRTTPPAFALSEWDCVTLNRALHSACDQELGAWFNALFDGYARQHDITETETFLMLDVSAVLLTAILEAVRALPLQISLNREEFFGQLETYTTVEKLRTHIDMLLKNAKLQIDQQLAAADMTINRVTEYINSHLADAITLEEVAGAVYLTPSYLSEYFKTKTGTNFKDYLLQRRIERATELLRQRSYRVQEVAAKCGYGDFKHFCKVFKKVIGVTPTEFRRIYG